MSPKSRSPALPYAVAALASAAALLVRWPLWPLLGNSVPYITFFPAVMLAAYLGGLGPGLLATALGAGGPFTSWSSRATPSRSSPRPTPPA